MKINKVYRGSISGVKAYFIEYEGGGVFVQRTAPSSASDTPLSTTEEIICALASACEERDRLRKDSEIWRNTAHMMLNQEYEERKRLLDLALSHGK